MATVSWIFVGLIICLYHETVSLDCSRNQFECRDRKFCIDAIEKRCDGDLDCSDGSDEDNSHCETMEFIFFSEGSNVYMKMLITETGEEYTRLLNISLSKTSRLVISGLSFDSETKTLFIADSSKPAIYSVNVFSGQIRFLVSENIDYPVDIAFDWTSDNLYWVDSDKRTVEVVNVNSLKRLEILHGLSNPTAIALSPDTATMFIATAGSEPCISKYSMDGINGVILNRVQGFPASLAINPFSKLLYWTDALKGAILYVNYTNSSEPSILRTGLRGIMSLTVTRSGISYTVEKKYYNPPLHTLKLGGYRKSWTWKSVVSTFGEERSKGGSECKKGPCSDDHLCITSQISPSGICAIQAFKFRAFNDKCLGTSSGKLFKVL